MMLDIKTNSRIGKNEFHQNKAWVNIIAKKANGRPVVFLNSYQRPSKYWFYSGQLSLGMNTPDYRRNNYNFWPAEEACFGKPVYVVGKYDTLVLKDTIIAPRFSETGAQYIPLYYSFMKARFTEIQNKASTKSITSSFNVSIPAQYLSYFKTKPFDTACIQLAILKPGEKISYYPSLIAVNKINQQNVRLSVNFAVKLPKGVYDARLGISSAVPGHPSLNSPSFRFNVD